MGQGAKRVTREPQGVGDRKCTTHQTQLVQNRLTGGADEDVEMVKKDVKDAENGSEDVEKGSEDVEKGSEDGEKGSEEREKGSENVEMGDVDEKPFKEPASRTCAKVCINYEPTKRYMTLSGSKSVTVTGVLQLAKPPENDEEDSRVPRAMFWTRDEVGSWISTIGFPQYKQCLETNHITGKQLILLNANSLPQMGITIHNHIKIILKNLYQLLGVTTESSRKSVASRPREEIALYLEQKSIRGEKTAELTYEKFLHQTQDAIWQPQHLSNFAFMAPPEKRILVPALRK